MIKNLLLFKCVVLSFLLSNASFAQNKPLEVCGTEELQADFFKKNPGFKEIYDAKLLEFNEARKQGKFSKKQTEIIEIPIVVHILDDGKGLYVPTDAQVNAWIARANAIWDGSASDIKGPGAGGTTLPVRLVLAKRSPSCEATTGIVKHDLSQNQTYVDGGVANGGSNPGIPYATINSTYNWDSSSYFNIYITNKINGVNPSTPGINSYTAGFATYPGQSVDLSVMLYHVVIKSTDTVLAHEMMHAFGVKHVFEGGDGEGKTCGSLANDNITDTQVTRSGLFFGASINQNGQYNQYKVYPDNTVVNDCANGALFDGVQYNMMNYGSRLDRFTPGQGQYAVDVINQMRPSFKTSKALVPINPNETSSSPIPSQCRPQNLINKAADGQLFNIGITKVKFGTINVSSGTPMGTTGVVFYTDNTTKSCISNAFTANVEEGSVVNVELTAGRVDFEGSFSVFIDYNNDGIFGSNETVIPFSTATNGLLKTAITIPTTAVQNIPLRMRVVGDYANSITACGNLYYGEAEDYTVIITAPAAVIWNGTTWSSEPTTAKEAIVRGNLSLTTNVSAKKLTVESGSVIVKKGSVLTVENEIVNNLTADKFIVEDGASVLQTNATANVGNVTVLKNSTPMVFNDATLWSSPVDGQNVRSFSPATLDKRFYIYNEGTNKFASLFVNDPLYPNSSLQNPNTYNFVAGLGYHIRVSNNQTQTEPGLAYAGKFIGKLNNGLITQPITKNGSGYNLLGNPYPSAIDAKKLIQANSSIQALHFWTHETPLTSTGYASNNYASYNLTGGTQAAAGGLIPNNIINPGQGFIVETTASGSLTFDNSLRTGSLTGSFYKTSESDEKRIWIDLFEGTTPKNQILIGYIENATNSFDNQMDATVNKLYTGSTLYSLIDNLTDHFVIQGRSLPFNQDD
ncbi:MAG: GEVED domain-containing protein, partial [Algoriella sp.]